MDAQANEHDIERLVMAEPATGAAILRFANSALYHRGTPSTSLWQAMMLLGHETIRHIAGHVAMMQLVQGFRSDVLRQAGEELHHHSIVVAAIGECIAGRGDRASAETCATLALFHEMPLFLWLARLDHQAAAIAGPAALAQAAESASLMGLERTLVDLGLPDFATPSAQTRLLIHCAHQQSWVANPIRSEATDDKGVPAQFIVSEADMTTVRCRVATLLGLIGAHADKGGGGADGLRKVDEKATPAPAPPAVAKQKQKQPDHAAEVACASSEGRSSLPVLQTLAIAAAIVAALIAWWPG